MGIARLPLTTTHGRLCWHNGQVTSSHSLSQSIPVIMYSTCIAAVSPLRSLSCMQAHQAQDSAVVTAASTVLFIGLWGVTLCSVFHKM